jgi:uncharacterized damage-inducible protein DinB
VAVPDPPKRGSERETLLSFLDYYRAVIVDKASDLTEAELGRRFEPSTMTLAGIVYHLAIVEESWFSEIFAGNELGEPWASVDWDADRDWEWHVAPTLGPEAVIDAYRKACERSNDIAAGAASLDEPSQRTGRDGEPFSLRWILVHMIEETARHAGHADLFREAIDGSTGDFRSET